MPMATPELQRAYQREWRRARRKAWIDDNGPCAWCGSWYALEVDHINSHRKVCKYNHAVWSWSLVRRLKELALCQVLCFDCHQSKTQSCGDNHRRTKGNKLTIETASAIKERIRNGDGTKILALDFGVDRTTIQQMRRGESWSYL